MHFQVLLEYFEYTDRQYYNIIMMYLDRSTKTTVNVRTV